MTENTNITRIASDPEPDLQRSESGFTIQLYMTPSLDAPEKAIIQVHAGPIIIDQVEVPHTRGHEVYRHTTLHSEMYAEALR